MCVYVCVCVCVYVCICMCTGSGPYKQWEKQPLCTDVGEAASSSVEDEEESKQHSASRTVQLRRLLLINCTLFAVILIGGTAVVS